MFNVMCRYVSLAYKKQYVYIHVLQMKPVGYMILVFHGNCNSFKMLGYSFSVAKHAPIGN